MDVNYLLAAGQIFAAKVTGSSGAISNPTDSAMSASRSATGTYTVTIPNVIAPTSRFFAFVFARTADCTITVTGISKSGDTVTVSVKGRSVGTTPVDADCDFDLFAFGTRAL